MAKMPRPASIEDYYAWAQRTFGTDFQAAAVRNRYEINLQSVQNAIQNSAFFRELPDFLERQEEAYTRRTGYSLLTAQELRVMRKPYDSTVVKTFRVNVLRNQRFPDPPSDDGWITPDNWYTRFDDMVRGTLVCKFLDGPRTVSQALDTYASSHGLVARHTPRSTDDGYYAFHHYTTFQVEIFDAAFQTQAASVQLEVQLTTQLQEVLRDLTHPLYEQARVTTGRRDETWKWDHDSPRFKTGYLGHTLHMIEAVIVQVRESLRTSTPAGNREDAGATAPPTVGLAVAAAEPAHLTGDADPERTEPNGIGTPGDDLEHGE